MNKKIIGTGILSLVSLTMLSAYTLVQVEVKSEASVQAHQMRHHENHGQHISEYASQNKGSRTNHHGLAVSNYNKLYNYEIVPADIEPAMNSTYNPGEEAIITKDHMPGMIGVVVTQKL